MTYRQNWDALAHSTIPGDLEDTNTHEQYCFPPTTRLPTPSPSPFAQLRNFADASLSEPSSPSIEKEREIYIAELAKTSQGNPVTEDLAILDEFIWHFDNRIASSIPCFRSVDITVTEDTREEYYLAMAAVGGLLCPLQGSFKIAHCLFNSSRLKLLGFVSFHF